jgi:hypothetical protein
MSETKDKGQHIDALNSILKEYKPNNEELNQLNIRNENLLNTISVKLVNFTNEHCKKELNDVSKYYNVSISDKAGYKFDPKNKEDQNIHVLHNLERCIDRYTSLNKKITLYEIDFNEIIHTNKQCNRDCIKTSHENKESTDSDLKECFNSCLKRYFSNSSLVMSNFFKDLSTINDKI